MAKGLGGPGSTQIIVLSDSLEFTDCIEGGKQQSVLLTGSSIEGVFDSVHDRIFRILESLLARYRITFQQSAFKSLSQSLAEPAGDIGLMFSLMASL
jgi:hypothetical protein